MGLTVACVQVGNYEGRGAEYVNKLYLMARRNITLPFRFACLTDDASGYLSDVDAISVPTDIRNIKGWFSKLCLFMPGVFPKGERVFYLDLDTVIVGNIDDFACYDGFFAGLGDFRSFRLFGSGVMLWEAGTVDHLWTEWVRQNHPLGDGADDTWIGQQEPKAVRIQRKLDGIVSYKFHKCRDAPPKGARICVFQRRPKPHECGDATEAGYATITVPTTFTTGLGPIATLY